MRASAETSEESIDFDRLPAFTQNHLTSPYALQLQAMPVDPTDVRSFFAFLRMFEARVWPAPTKAQINAVGCWELVMPGATVWIIGAAVSKTRPSADRDKPYLLVHYADPQNTLTYSTASRAIAYTHEQIQTLRSFGERGYLNLQPSQRQARMITSRLPLTLDAGGRIRPWLLESTLEEVAPFIGHLLAQGILARGADRELELGPAYATLAAWAAACPTLDVLAQRPRPRDWLLPPEYGEACPRCMRTRRVYDRPQPKCALCCPWG